MRIIEATDTAGRRAEPTPDDDWCIIVFETGTDTDRMTVVGPYRGISGLARAQEDREAWRAAGVPCVVARMMPPAAFEKSLQDGDFEQFGYAAKVSADDQTKPKNPPPWAGQRIRETLRLTRRPKE